VCVVAFDGDDVEDEDDVEDDFVEGLEVAAWATAAPPPTRAPEIVSAIRAFVSRCRMGRSPPFRCCRSVGHQ